MTTWTTPLNTTLSPPIASVGHRLSAFLIDLVIISTLSYIFYEIVNLFHLYSDVWSVVLYTPLMLYTLLFEYFFDGRTPGKTALGIKVVDENGRPLNFTALFMRWVMRLVDFYVIFGMGFIIMLATRRRQRLGGLISETMVIQMRPRSLNTTLPVIRQPTASYTPFYPYSKAIPAKDIEIITNVLRMPLSQKRESVTAELAERIQSVYGINTTDQGRTFLIRVKQDYLELMARG